MKAAIRNLAALSMLSVTLVAVLLLAVATPALAEIDVAGWQFKDISASKIGITFGLSFDSQKIAFVKQESGTGDVFLFDLASGAETRVTSTPENEIAVGLDGERLCWAAEPASDSMSPSKLYLRDLGTGETQLIAEGRVSADMGIHLAGGHVVWAQFDPGASGLPGQPAGHYALYLYTLSSGTTVRVTDRLASGGGYGGKTSFALGESQLAYVKADADGDVGEAFLLDLASGATTDLGPSAPGSHHVSLAGDLVTWAAPGVKIPGDAYEPTNVFIHQISTGSTTQIATAQSYAVYPKTDGRFVVWENALPNPIMPRSVIVGYDTKTKDLIDVSHNLFLNFTPEISEGEVVWERGGELDSEVMAADLKTGEITQLSDNYSWVDQAAQIHGRTVIWWKHWSTSEPGPEPSDQMMLATAPASAPDPFADVGGTYRYRTAALGVTEQGVASGYQTDTGMMFQPDAPLLRAQFAKMICEALKVPVTEEMSSPFTDLGPDNPANLYPHQYVAALAAAGVIKGQTATIFAPYAPVTRAQAVSLLVRALDVYSPGLLRQVDAEPPGAYHWEPPHLANLRRAYANDLMGSMVDWLQQWDARAQCSRGEAAQLIWNALSLVNQRAAARSAGTQTH